MPFLEWLEEKLPLTGKAFWQGIVTTGKDLIWLWLILIIIAAQAATYFWRKKRK